MLVPNRPRCAAPAQIGCVRCPDTIQVANHLLGRLGGCCCAASLPAWPVVCPVCGWVPALKLMLPSLQEPRNPLRLAVCQAADS